jgi:hypothetical protein
MISRLEKLLSGNEQLQKQKEDTHQNEGGIREGKRAEGKKVTVDASSSSSRLKTSDWATH